MYISHYQYSTIHEKLKKGERKSLLLRPGNARFSAIGYSAVPHCTSTVVLAPLEVQTHVL